MQLLKLTLPIPAENVALDEALLDAAENGELTDETLRLWEMPQLAVVVGSSTRMTSEVNVAACRHAQVPVLRRASGGASIVAGPGCLMYAVVLSLTTRPELRDIGVAHRWVLARVLAAVRGAVPHAALAGTSDLVVGVRKFSGNALRVKRGHLLYHGTLLYDFPLAQIGRLLTMPPRMPDYRGNRSHDEFVMNLPMSRTVLEEELAGAFAADDPCADWPQNLTARLVTEKYGRAEWNENRML